MNKQEEILQKIREAFGATTIPEILSCKAAGKSGHFRWRTNSESLEASFLDEHASALSFLSEAGLRFFLPAYLRADVREELKFADPVITGFWAVEVKVIMHGREFLVRSGRSELLNPRRYGAATFYDRARYRFSIFTLEEAIVAYLEYKRDVDPGGPDAARIDAAVDGYWGESEKRVCSGRSKEAYSRKVPIWSGNRYASH